MTRTLKVTTHGEGYLTTQVKVSKPILACLVREADLLCGHEGQMLLQGKHDEGWRHELLLLGKVADLKEPVNGVELLVPKGRWHILH